MDRNETAPVVLDSANLPSTGIKIQEHHESYSNEIIVNVSGMLVKLPPPPRITVTSNAAAPVQPVYPNYSIPQAVIQDEVSAADTVKDAAMDTRYALNADSFAEVDEEYYTGIAAAYHCQETEGSDGNAVISSAYTEPAIIDLTPFHKYKDGKAVGVIDMNIVTCLIQNKHFFVINGNPYVYEGGVYLEDSEGILLKTAIQKLMYPYFITSYKVTSIYKLLISQLEVQRRFIDINQYPKHWINFKNGMFDVKAFVMWPHDPKYYSINQIPHALDLSLNLHDVNKYSNMVQFMQFAIPAHDDREMLFEYLGYAMTPDTQFQKFMVIKGKSNSGKGRIIKIFLYIIGELNKTVISLKQLTERFYPTKLYGKILGTCGDISSQDLNDISVVKQVTGEDELTHELKGVDSRDFLSYAKLLFSTNRIPKNKDEQSDAFYNRLLILLMDNVSENLDGELINRIIPEIPYIILLAVNCLRNAYERGGLLESQNSKRLVHQLRRDSDNVTAFCEDCLQPNSGGGEKTTDVHKAYKAYCDTVNEQPLGRTKFYDALTEKGLQRTPFQGVEYFVDIRLVRLV